MTAPHPFIRRNLRTGGRLAAAAGLVLGLTSCSTPAPPPPPPVVVVEPPPPPPPPLPPSITLGSQVVELASAYRAVMQTSAAIPPHFEDGPSVSRAVRLGAAFEPNQLQQGMIAFAAIAALQEPNFVASVRIYVGDKGNRELLTRRLMDDPNQVLSFDNVDKAAGLAIDALDRMGAKVVVNGRDVKQQAYDIQKQAWSKVAVPDAALRLSESKDLSGRRQTANVDDVELLKRATSGAAAMSLAGPPVPPPYTPAITRALAIAAIAALGGAGDDVFESSILPLLTESTSSNCMNFAKLNLFQCLAVSKPYYEDVFCLGQHAVIDPGVCVMKAANSPNPAWVEPPPIIPPPAPRPKGKAPAKAKAKAAARPAASKPKGK